MVTVHFNGSIIQHPDTRANYARRMDEYQAAGKCKYGFAVWQCQDAKPELLKNARYLTRETLNSCYLGNCGVCPKYIERVQHGQIKKQYYISNKHYTQIADRVAWMKENAKHKMLFLTLTLPKFKKHITIKTVENEINKCFSKFVENLKENYQLQYYLAVREGDGCNKRYHYHFIAVLPYFNFQQLNNAWCIAIKDICEHSKNALTSDPTARYIRTTGGAVRYICKYISKARGAASNTRIIFCDRQTAQAAVKITTDHTPGELLQDYKTTKMHQLNDYVTRFTISDSLEYTRFFNRVIRVLFKTYRNTNTVLYHFNTEQQKN